MLVLSVPERLSVKWLDGITLDRSNVRLVTHSQNNAFMFCDIYDVMNDSQDGGAIYSWGGDEGQYCRIQSYSRYYDSFLVRDSEYLDDAADVFTVKKNIVDNMWREGFGGKTMASIFAKGIKHTIDNNFCGGKPEKYVCVHDRINGRRAVLRTELVQKYCEQFRPLYIL